MDTKLAELKKLLDGFDAAMMTTIDTDGHLVARPMATQKKEVPDADVWFVGMLDSDQVKRLQLDPRVNIAYFHEKGDRSYASLAGKAHLSNDRERIRSLWDESWRPWAPDGPDDGNLCLILVEAIHGQFWKPEGGKLATMFHYAKAYLTGTEPEMNPPEQVAFTQA